MPNIQMAAIISAIKCAIQKCDKKKHDNTDYDITTTKAGDPMPMRSRCTALGSKKHKCVEETLKNEPGIKTEQTFDMRPPPPPKPATKRPPKGKGRRPDIVVGGPPQYDVYDAKFPCSDDVKSGAKTTGPMESGSKKGINYKKPSSKEAKAYKKIANGGKSTALTPEDCKNEPCGS